MKFQKGQPRPPGAGRKKGIPNRKSLLKVTQILANLDINPVAEILKLIPSLDPEMATKTWFELLKYIEPQKKAVEVSLELPPAPDYPSLTDAQVLDVLSLPESDD